MKAEVLREVCSALSNNELDKAKDNLSKNYPFVYQQRFSRQYSITIKMGVFLKDGFIDRYKGTRLVNPGALRIISLVFPDFFPYHKNGKMDLCHIAFWELFPTIDHIVPIARGGEDIRANLVTSTMLSNAAKGLWLLEELGWNLLPPGNLNEWDGLTQWFCDTMESDIPTFDKNLPYLQEWYKGSKRALAQRDIKSG